MTCVILTFVSVLIYNYYVSKNIIVKNVKNNAETLAISTLRKIMEQFHAVQQIAEDLSSVLEHTKITEKELLELLSDIVKNNYEICGCEVSFEPYAFDKTKYYFSPYFYRDGDVVKCPDLSNQADHKYLEQNWYVTPKKLNKAVWSEPYQEEESIFMVTYSQPFYKIINGKKKFCGVVGCDVHLNWLGKFISDIKILESGFVFILSSQGDYIAHKRKDYSHLDDNIFSLAKSRGEIERKVLGEKMTSHQTGFEEYYSHTLNEKCFVYYTPLEETGWALGVVIPQDELLSDLNTITLKLFIMGLVGYILTLCLIIALAGRITKPLRILTGATYEIGEGDFNAKLPIISSKDEIGVLSHSFHAMQESLIKYISNLQETTAAKEKIEKELSIAREIQQSLLPHKFSRLRKIDLYATLIPAREVGGDLYDFFFIDEKHLCFAIGDVSGKGVPAALFMAVAKTLLRAKISHTMDPAKVFNVMNEDLSKEQESYMFVTFFLGILNIETGILEYCNAGHNPPLIRTAHKGFYYFHTKDIYPPLGIMADANYVRHKIKLLPEDIFFLYTDGVTEAMNIDEIQFSEEKLIDVLDKNKDKAVSNIVSNVKIALEQHVSGTTQSDDIAMLIIKYNG